MHRVRIENQILLAEDGELLSHVLQKNGMAMAHPCGGMGLCGKCMLLVDGKQELSCQYRILRDISVTLQTQADIHVPSDVDESRRHTENMCYALDLGSTTLALALVSLDEKRVVRVITRDNPQRAFGADIMSRISYCQTHPQSDLHAVTVAKIENMIAECGATKPLPLFVSGNTTMLHLLLNEDCRGIGTAPYTPVFLEATKAKGFLEGVSEIETLPSLHAFVGADLVAGLYHVGMPSPDKYRLLVDLGTNAEIVLFSRERVLCTSAAAGPCFEGAGIACGMSATSGAICSVRSDHGVLKYQTIGNAVPKGLCGTGLIDLVATLLDMGLIDQSGYLEDEAYPLTECVCLEAADVRALQLAKSAVCCAILSLMKAANITFDEIENLYLAGGFSAKIDLQSAAKIGLLPKELTQKAISVGNASLLGTVKYALERQSLSPFTQNASYIDLAATPEFSELFMKNMAFE
ncbi:MAG: DUF4445 domain-containing protein [Clostridia bacterium]|nr:DUF4445 domain-containing protein [Clostridia bacterium]